MECVLDLALWHIDTSRPPTRSCSIDTVTVGCDRTFDLSTISFSLSCAACKQVNMHSDHVSYELYSYSEWGVHWLMR